MAGGYSERAARRVAAMMVRGENVPIDVQEAVARVQTDGGSSQDAMILKNFLGDRRSGAHYVKKFQRTVNAVTRPIFNIEAQLQLLAQAGESGQGTAVAQQRVLDTVLKEVQTLSSSKFAKNTAVWVAEALGKEPRAARALLSSLGRGLRLGGAAGAVVFGAIQIGEAFFASREKTAQSVSRTKDLLRGLNTDARLGREIEERVRAEVRRGSIAPTGLGWRTGVGFFDTALESIDEFLQGRISQKGEKIIQQEAQTMAAARTAAAYLGVDVQSELARQAAKKGKLVSELSEKDINEALDSRLRGALYGGQPDAGLDSYVNSSMAKRAPLDAYLDRWFPESGEARKEQFTRDYRARQAKTAQARKEEFKKNAEQTRYIRGLDTPAENVRIKQEQDMQAAGLASYRSRHRAWAND